MPEKEKNLAKANQITAITYRCENRERLFPVTCLSSPIEDPSHCRSTQTPSNARSDRR